MLLCARSAVRAVAAAALSGEPQPRREEEEVSIRIRPAQPQKRRRAQWSSGTAPGEYGGPPVSFKPTPMWGGTKADPLDSKDDYIWKQDWQPHVRVPEAPQEQSRASPSKEPAAPQNSGFLSLNRALALDSMDVDLSQELRKPSRATLERQVQAAREAALLAEQRALAGSQPKPVWNFAPTRREEERWARARTAATGRSGSEALRREATREVVDPVEVAARDEARYQALKRELLLLTLGIGGICTGCVWLYYTPEVAASYGLGVVGSVAYVRMLGQSIDSVGTNSLGRAVKGAAGQPRLLVPVFLVMLYNRWNEVLVPEYDLLHLQLVPMLVGFFTYKAATLYQTFRALLPGTPPDQQQVS